MSNKNSLEPLLESLLPTWTHGAIPAPLTNLAAALLVQSRSKASTLKPEEEIARSYACANLAAERLKQRLNLPKIEPNPPCAPKVYKKLYQYLDKALPAKQNGAAAHTPTSSKSAKVQDTPKTQRPVGTVNTSQKKRDIRNLADAQENGEVPEWVYSAIRRLCKDLDAPAVIPHAYAGAETLIRQQTAAVSGSRKRKSDGPASVDVDGSGFPSIIVAVVLCVLEQLDGSAESADQTGRTKNQELILDSLAAQKVISKKEKSGLESEVEVLLANVSENWSAMEWFRNMQSGAHHSATDGSRNLLEELDDGPLIQGMDMYSKLEPGSGSLQIGLGTMMQDKVDWLSEERRRDFVEWKAGIMAQIKQIEQRKGSSLTG